MPLKITFISNKFLLNFNKQISQNYLKKLTDDKFVHSF